jgi:copper(I)-binding protein
MDHAQMDHSKMDMGGGDSGKDAAAMAKPVATIGDIAIAAPFARATPVKVGGAFMLLKNNGKTDDKLIKAASPVAEHVELHEHVMDGGTMRMRPVEGGVPVPAGKMAELQPGGYHVMLIGLKQPLKEGGHFPLTLTFEKAGTVTIEVPILKPGATGAMPMDKKP